MINRHWLLYMFYRIWTNENCIFLKRCYFRISGFSLVHISFSNVFYEHINVYRIVWNNYMKIAIRKNLDKSACLMPPLCTYVADNRVKY